VDAEKKIMGMVRNALTGAEDNLYRANQQFGTMSDQQLDQEYGRAGKTCRQLFTEYQDEVDDIKGCMQWIKEKGV